MSSNHQAGPRPATPTLWARLTAFLSRLMRNPAGHQASEEIRRQVYEQFGFKPPPPRSNQQSQPVQPQQPGRSSTSSRPRIVELMIGPDGVEMREVGALNLIWNEAINEDHLFFDCPCFRHDKQSCNDRETSFAKEIYESIGAQLGERGICANRVVLIYLKIVAEMMSHVPQHLRATVEKQAHDVLDQEFGHVASTARKN